MSTSSAILTTTLQGGAIHYPENTDAATQHPLSLPEDSELKRLWDEFTIGMNCLSKYMHQSRINYADVVRSNVQLLHSNLKRNKLYQKHLSAIQDRCDRKSSAIPTQPLISGHGSQARLIYARATTHAIDLPDFENFHGQANHPTTKILMVIKGKLLNHSSTNENVVILKANDVLIEDRALPNSDMKFSVRKDTTLLSIVLRSPQQ